MTISRLNNGFFITILRDAAGCAIITLESEAPARSAASIYRQVEK